MAGYRLHDDNTAISALINKWIIKQTLTPNPPNRAKKKNKQQRQQEDLGHHASDPGHGPLFTKASSKTLQSSLFYATFTHRSFPPMK